MCEIIERHAKKKKNQIIKIASFNQRKNIKMKYQSIIIRYYSLCILKKNMRFASAEKGLALQIKEAMALVAGKLGQGNAQWILLGAALQVPPRARKQEKHKEAHSMAGQSKGENIRIGEKRK